MEPDFTPLIRCFPEQTFAGFFEAMVVYLQEYDILDTNDKLPQLLEERKDLSDSCRKELTEMLALYRYFSHGEYKAYKTGIPKTLYALLLEGIHAVNWGEYGRALVCLGAAMKLRNKNSLHKNLFMNFLNCFI